MRSGGSVLKAPRATEGALPASIVRKPTVQNLREHPPRAAYTNCLYTQKRLSGISESLLYVLELAKLSLYGVAGHAERGSVLKALSAAEGHSPRAGTGYVRSS